jgi:hypothetical protein
MKNKTIANWLIGVLSASLIGGMLDVSDDVYTVLGIGFLVFGIIAIVRLYKLPDTN